MLLSAFDLNRVMSPEQEGNQRSRLKCCMELPAPLPAAERIQMSRESKSGLWCR